MTRSISTPPGWDASPSQGYPSIKFAGNHLYTWVERGTVRVKCLVQEHNTISPVPVQCSLRAASARGIEQREKATFLAALHQTPSCRIALLFTAPARDSKRSLLQGYVQSSNPDTSALTMTSPRLSKTKTKANLYYFQHSVGNLSNNTALSSSALYLVSAMLVAITIFLTP